MERLRLALDSVVYFFYGLGFFVLGLATTFHYRPRSEFRLTKSIWALAGFGVLHAFHEWARVFAPIQEAVLSPFGVLLLRVAEAAGRAFSWALLLHFGLLLLPTRERWIPVVHRVPLALSLGWTALVARGTHLALAGPGSFDQAYQSLASLDLLAHLALGLPAALVTAWVLLVQAAQFRATRLERLVHPLQTAAASFLVYAMLIALAVSSSTSAVPFRILQLITVVVMTLATGSVLQVFNLEGERRLEEAETQRAVLNERLRISRDLHDGVMQSVYAVGLALENVLFLMNEDRERARQELERSMTRLNDTIRDIRGYILNLRPARRSPADLRSSVLDVVAQFRASVAIRTNIDLEPLRRVSLPPEQVEEVCQIVREALTNVARHAQATEVAVTAHAGWGKSVEISVWDNGRGFSLGSANLEGRQGLGNMRARAEALGGSLAVHSRYGRGTEVVLRLPVGGGDAGAEDKGSAG